MAFNVELHRFQDRAFDTATYAIYALYILVALGLSTTAPVYLNDLQFYMKIYISLFLIYRFNPFRRVRFTALDAKIAFSAGFFLLFMTLFDSTLQWMKGTDKEMLNLGGNLLEWVASSLGSAEDAAAVIAVV